MTSKVKAAIIGSGNIGTDLLSKALRSDVKMVDLTPAALDMKKAGAVEWSGE